MVDLATSKVSASRLFAFACKDTATPVPIGKRDVPVWARIQEKSVKSLFRKDLNLNPDSRRTDRKRSLVPHRRLRLSQMMHFLHIRQSTHAILSYPRF
jgi:hypothetical protein